MSASRKPGWKKVLPLLIVLAIGIGGGVGLEKWITGRGAATTSEKGQQTLYTCPMHPEVIENKPGSCPICGMTLVPVKNQPAAGAQSAEDAKTPPGKRKILYWVAPMDPSYISDKPGKSPMGMNLVPVYEGQEPGAGGVIKIDPTVVQNLGVRTAEAKLGKMTKKVQAVSTFETDEASLASVNTKVDGWIEKLYINKTGQEVKKGDPLLTIYSPALMSTEQEYIESLKYLESVKASPYKEVVDAARTLVRASEERLRLWDVSREQIHRLARTGRVERDLTLYAPVNGVVMKREAVEGMKVMPGMELLAIADLSTLWAQTRFYEQDVPWVHVGDHARIEVDYLPGDTFSGKVSFIYPYLNDKTRDITARIVIDNCGLKLKPGMYATITMEHESAKPVVYIPDEAVIRTGIRNYVFIDLGGGRFVPRQVQLGRYGDGRTIEILSGLQPGEKVAVSGQFLIDSESRMEEAVRKMLEAQKAGQQAEQQPKEQMAQQPAAEAPPASSPPQKMNMPGMEKSAAPAKPMNMPGMNMKPEGGGK